MKRICLTLFFATYYFFMPFVMVNCAGTDQDYIKGQAEEALSLKECQTMDVVVQECVDLLQAESQRIASESAKVSKADDAISDFEDCTAAESMDTDAEEDACVKQIDSMVEAYQICTSLSGGQKYRDCQDIEDVVNQSTAACDAGIDDFSENFCASLSA